MAGKYPWDPEWYAADEPESLWQAAAVPVALIVLAIVITVLFRWS